MLGRWEGWGGRKRKSGTGDCGGGEDGERCAYPEPRNTPGPPYMVTKTPLPADKPRPHRPSPPPFRHPNLQAMNFSP